VSPLASIVDGHALLQVVWVGAVTGLGVTVAFGFAILGMSRASELGRHGRSGAALLYGALGAVALAVVAAAVVYGIVVMTQK
jgi:uncharacterized membrane protein